MDGAGNGYIDLGHSQGDNLYLTENETSYLDLGNTIVRNDSINSTKVVTDTLKIGGEEATGIVSLETAIEDSEFDSLNIGGYKIKWNSSEGVHEFETGINGVVWQGALEDLVQLYNNTGVTVTNGTPFAFGAPQGDTIAGIQIASANNASAKGARGLVTGDIAPGSWGYGCTRGKVRNINTSGLSTLAASWLSNDSSLTDTAPAYPSEKVLMGGAIKIGTTDGVFYVDPSFALIRELKTKSYNFTSQGIGSGTYYRAGFYDFTTTAVTLNQATISDNFGAVNNMYSSHPFIVCSGAGTVDAGVIGVRITGASIDDNGVRIPNDADTVITDITSVSTDQYFEAKKFIGRVTYELIVISGSPTTYSFTYNEGTAKYDDLGNNDFYITGVEAVGLAGATDASFEIELLHHKTTGWTYAATGFNAGNGVIATTLDLAPENDLISGEPFSFKISNIAEFINGSGIEGYIWRITTTNNNTIQSMDMHVSYALD
jgi:hypothetical protein